MILKNIFEIFVIIKMIFYICWVYSCIINFFDKCIIFEKIYEIGVIEYSYILKVLILSYS